MSSLPESTAPFHSRGRAAIAVVGVLVALLLAWLLLRSREVDTPPPPAPAPVQAESATPIADEPPPTARVESTPEPDPIPADFQDPIDIGITGRVVDHDSNAPIPHATLTLISVRYTPAGPEYAPAGETRTGPDGSFALPPVPTASYRLRTRAEGYATQEDPLVVPTLTRAQAASDARLSVGDIQLQHGFRALVRAVDSDTRAPISGASVYVFEANPSPIPTTFLHLGTTNAQGELRNERAIAIQSENTTALVLSEEGFGLLALASGDRNAAEREFEIPVLRGGQFVVEVRDEAGAPLAGARVRARPSGYPIGPLGYATSALLDLSNEVGDGGRLEARFQVTTDEQGRVRLHGLPRIEGTRDYMVSAGLQGYSGKPLSDLQPSLGDSQPIALELHRLPHIASVEGTVRTVDGSPPPEARLRAGRHSTRSDRTTGKYVLTNLDAAAGTFWVEASAPGWITQEKFPHEDMPEKGVLDFTLERAHSISGFVQDEKGAPLAQVNVYARPVGADVNQGWSPATPLRTLVDGRFVFPGLRGGEYEVRASPETPGLVPLQFAHKTVPTDTRDLVLVGVRDSSTRGDVHATVVRVGSREPVDIATAALMPRNSDYMTPRPRPETFRIGVGEIDVPAVAVGRWSLWVLAADGSMGLAEFTTTEASPSAEVEVLMRTDSTLRGRLVAAAGTTAPKSWKGFRISAAYSYDWVIPPSWRWQERAMRHGWATAAADGSFEFEGLLPGLYVLQSSQDSLHGMIRVDLQDPKLTSVDLVLRTSGVADVVIEGPIELFDGLTMLRYSESSIEWPEFPLRAEVAGTNRWRMRVESGPIQIQAWRRTGPVETDAPKKFFFDETLELGIGETRTLTLPLPR